MNPLERSGTALSAGPVLLNRLTALALALFVLALSLQQIHSPEIGFHLRAGRWIVEHGRFPVADPFTYTAGTHTYVDLHWLYQIMAFAIDTVAGQVGLVLWNAALILLSFFLLLLRCFRRSSLERLSSWQIALFVSIWSVSFLFDLRPYVLSWIYLNLLLLILEDYFERRSNFLLLVPLVMLFWTNSHSWFVLGWIVILAYAAGASWEEKRIWTPLAPVALISVGVSFLNPYFAGGVALPFREFAMLRSGMVLKQTLQEFASPMSAGPYVGSGHFSLFQPFFPFHLLLLICVVVLVFRLRKILLHELLIFLFFGYLACTRAPFIGSFVIVILPTVLLWLQAPDGGSGDDVQPNILRRLFRGAALSWNAGKVQAALNILVILAVCCFVVSIINGSYDIGMGSAHRFGVEYDSLALPVEAAAFLTDNDLEGRIMNDVRLSGYLANAIPQKLFVDGRDAVMGETLRTLYSRYWQTAEKDSLLDRYRPRIIIFPGQDEFFWIQRLKRDPTWRLAHADPAAVVYLKSGEGKGIPAIDSTFYMSGYQTFDSSRIDSILKKGYPSSSTPFAFDRHYYPAAELNLSTFCYYNDWYGAAIQIALNGLEKSTVPCPIIYYALGHYFYEQRDVKRSTFCYKRFLEHNSDPLAQARVASMTSGGGK